MLTSHPQLTIPAETKFIPGQAARFDRQPFPSEEFVDWLSGRRRNRRHWRLDPTELSQRFEQRPPVDYADAVRRVFEAFAADEGKPRYGDKTPLYVMRIPTIAALFDEAVFIHIIRDGRDVAGSLHEAHFGPNHLGAAALYWERAVLAGRRDGGPLGDRYLEVRYEDLIADPREQLERICRRIELEYDPAMLQYHRDTDLQSRLMQPERHRRVGEPPSIGRDWREDQTSREVLLLEALAGSTLTELGYDLSRPTTPLWARTWAEAYGSADRVKQRLNQR